MKQRKIKPALITYLRNGLHTPGNAGLAHAPINRSNGFRHKQIERSEIREGLSGMVVGMSKPSTHKPPLAWRGFIASARKGWSNGRDGHKRPLKESR